MLSHPESKELNLTYFKKPDFATNKQLAQIIASSPDLMEYIPRDCKIAQLPRHYICTLLFYKKNDVYEDLKQKIKLRKRHNEFKTYEDFDVVLPNTILPVIDHFEEEEVKFLLKTYSLH